MLTYNQGWASYIPALNAAATPAAAADIYVTDFERAGHPGRRHPRGLRRGSGLRLRPLTARGSASIVSLPTMVSACGRQQ